MIGIWKARRLNHWWEKRISICALIRLISQYYLPTGVGQSDSPCILWVHMYSYYHLTPEAGFRKVTFVTQDHCKQTPTSKASSRKVCHEAIILCYLPNILNIFSSVICFWFCWWYCFLERAATVLNKIKNVLKQPTKKEMELVNNIWKHVYSY